MNKNLLKLEDIFSLPLKNDTLDESPITHLNITTTKDMEVGIRISLLAGENIIVMSNITLYYFLHEVLMVVSIVGNSSALYVLKFGK